MNQTHTHTRLRSEKAKGPFLYFGCLCGQLWLSLSSETTRPTEWLHEEAAPLAITHEGHATNQKFKQQQKRNENGGGGAKVVT